MNLFWSKNKVIKEVKEVETEPIVKERRSVERRIRDLNLEIDQLKSDITWGVYDENKV